MLFELFMPYYQGASIDMKDNLNGYYKTDKEYAEALITEDTSNGTMVYNTMSGGGFSGGSYYGFNPNERDYSKISEKIAYARAECRLLSPDGAYDEDVDSIIDKFASQNEFLVTAHFDISEMDGEFEEELREWAKETLNILTAGREIVKNGGTREESQVFVEKNIPRRELRLSFLNKSGKRVNFVLKSCEIERKIARNRYLFYVKRMEMLR
jgi:hypothetical protein